MQSKTLEQLTPAAAQTILANLPERIRSAFIDRAAEINYKSLLAFVLRLNHQ